MSIYEQAMEKCIIMDETTVSDGRGGVDTIWKAGAEILANIAYESSNSARIAEALTAKATFYITTYKNVTLEPLIVIRQQSSGRYFRVTNKGMYNQTPSGAGLNMRVVEAEEFFPTGVIITSENDNEGDVSNG